MKALHFDYVLGPPMTVGGVNWWDGEPALTSVAGNSILEGIPLQLDPDAPFLLRSIAVRYTYPVVVGCQRQQPLLNNLKIRFSGPNRNYLQQGLVPLSLLMAYGGQLGNPKSLWREIYYPPQASLLVDLQNTGGSAISNLTFYFRGVKLFPDSSAHQMYDYPPRMATNPFTYPVSLANVPATAAYNDLPFTAVQDADFVLRAIQGNASGAAGVAPPGGFFETFFRLRDENRYPYSSRPVHVDTLMGQAGNVPTYAAGGTTVTPIEAGPANPGLFVPEIYIPRQHQLFYDFYRNDSAYTYGGCAVTASFPFVLIGSKVWSR